MNKRQQMRQAARQDAASGVTKPEERAEQFVMALLGPRPTLNTDDNYRDRQTAARLRNTAALDELNDDVREREIERSQDTSRAGLWFQIAFLGGAECLAAILVMASIGLRNPHKSILGVMLAIALVYLTQQCTERSAQ